MTKSICKLSFFLFFHITTLTFLSSQISFKSTESLLSTSFHSGIAMGVLDMNGDHLDDLIVLDSTNKLYIAYQRETKHLFDIKYYKQNFNKKLSYSICAADVNRDYINDYIIGYKDGGDMYINQIDSSTHYFSTPTNIFIQGMNFIDFDHDGLLDLFVSNDIALNKLYQNTGEGFSFQENWIDFNTTIPSDNSGNYGSEWIDIDNDCDLDLYISKCRAGVLTPTDPRRVNVLYINDGNNNFKESAPQWGMDIGAQSWSTNFGDLDNDGDLDAFIVNHDDYFMLMENKLEIEKFVLKEDYVDQPLFALGFEGMLCDFDNDGLLDILITGQKDFLLKNNGDLKFSKIENPFGDEHIHSLGLGDLNNDGFIDVFASFATGINTPSVNYEDVIFLNEGNENNWVKFSLTGIQNNINAIGSKITIYGSWGQQTRIIRSGESYGIVNSFSQNFGIGTASIIDSVNIQWPDCSISKFYNVLPNQQYFITEYDCITTRSEIQIIGNLDLCNSDSVKLIAPEGNNYHWNNGETTKEIITSNAGNYFCRYDNLNGCLSYTNTLDVAYKSNFEPKITFLQNNINCLGTTIQLNTQNADGYLWNTGNTNATISVTETGIYSLVSTLGCQDYFSDTITITFLDTASAVVSNDTILHGEIATLTAAGDSVFWYNDINEAEAFFTGPQYITSALEETKHFFVTNRHYHFFNSQYVGINNIEREEQIYSASHINAGMIFDIKAPTLLKSVKVKTDLSGKRKIELIDKNGIVINSVEVMIEIGVSRIDLNFEIPIGKDYLLKTNEDFNNTHLGFSGPRLWRENQSIQYPYEIDKLISIKNSDKGNLYFYYFLDWEVQENPFYCESKKTKVSAIIDSVDATITEEFGDIKIFPNPSQHNLYIESNESVTYRISSINGTTIIESNKKQTNPIIDIRNLNQGLYYISIYIKNKCVVYKFVKQE